MRVSRAVVVVSVALVGCSSGPRDIAVQAPVARAAATAPARAAPVGTTLTVALLDELGTDWSVAHQIFRAVLVSDVTATDGSVVVRAGTPLYGVVTRARAGDAPLLALDFPAVTTASGKPSPLTAKLEDAPRASPGEDATLTEARAAGATAHQSGGRFYDERERLIRIPRGGRLRLQLTRPLVLPE